MNQTGQWSIVTGERRSSMILAIDWWLMTIDFLSLLATRQPLGTGVSMFRMAGPGFSAQQLDRHKIALVHTFNFDGDIDQAIGLHH